VIPSRDLERWITIAIWASSAISAENSIDWLWRAKLAVITIARKSRRCSPLAFVLSRESAAEKGSVIADIRDAKLRVDLGDWAHPLVCSSTCGFNLKAEVS
jgi:hypothetical protein